MLKSQKTQKEQKVKTIDFNTGDAVGFCLHIKHTRKVGEAVYKARNCEKCKHFMPLKSSEKPFRNPSDEQNEAQGVIIPLKK